MLATILKSNVAVKVSIAIMDTFVMMRKYISNDLIELNYMKRQILNNSKNIDKNIEDIKLLQQSFQKFEEKRKNSEIYFNGQIYDASSGNNNDYNFNWHKSINLRKLLSDMDLLNKNNKHHKK